MTDTALAPARRSERVLIVDDDRLALEFLKDALEEAGFPLQSFMKATDALAHLETGENYDLIVSDIDMPEMNGIEFLAAVRGKGLTVPVIFLTGNEQIERAIQAIRLGASDYIQKGREVGQTLLLAIDKVLDKQRLERENCELVVRLQRFNQELEKRVKEATEELKTANELLQKGVQELTILYEVSQAISSVMDLQVLLDLIMLRAKEVLHAEACSLLLMNDEGTELAFTVAQGSAGARVKQFTVKLGQGIAGHVAATGQSLLIPDAYEDPRFDPGYDKRSGFKTKSVLCVPMKVGDRITGIVQLINHVGGGSFTYDDLQMFEAIARQAAIGVENAKLLERTRRMADDLRQSLERERWISIEKEKMGRYIPKELVDEIHKNREAQLALGGKVIEATILFSDIAGFTTMSERLDPATVIKYLNGYMTEMVKIIEAEGGILDKFMGDGLMAVFKAEPQRPNHALGAVRAGIAMQRKVVELTKDWEAAGIGLLGIRVGINTGKVLSGNVGSETRMDYTVIGDNVNLASRLEGAGRAGEILIHETTYELVRGQVEPEPIKNQPILVKGKAQPVTTYLLLPGTVT